MAKQSEAEEIYEVLAAVDFDEAEEMYRRMNWRWWDGQPTAAQLRSTALKLLSEVQDNNICATGRVTAIRSNGKLSLFIGMHGYIF